MLANASSLFLFLLSPPSSLPLFRCRESAIHYRAYLDTFLLAVPVRFRPEYSQYPSPEKRRFPWSVHFVIITFRERSAQLSNALVLSYFCAVKIYYAFDVRILIALVFGE